jgi:hypothetical protein
MSDLGLLVLHPGDVGRETVRPCIEYSPPTACLWLMTDDLVFIVLSLSMGSTVIGYAHGSTMILDPARRWYGSKT